MLPMQIFLLRSQMLTRIADLAILFHDFKRITDPKSPTEPYSILWRLATFNRLDFEPEKVDYFALSN